MTRAEQTEETGMDELMKWLEEKADEDWETLPHDNDDFIASDWFGHADDAYDGGINVGEVLMAREVLRKLRALNP